MGVLPPARPCMPPFFAFQPGSVHVCGPFLLPIFRWGIDSSSSPPSVSDGPSGEAAGMEANKRRLTLDLAFTLQRWLKVWRSRASTCAGAVKPPWTERPTKGEADTRFLGSVMRHSQHALGAPSRTTCYPSPAEGAWLQQKDRGGFALKALSDAKVARLMQKSEAGAYPPAGSPSCPGSVPRGCRRRARRCRCPPLGRPTLIAGPLGTLVNVAPVSTSISTASKCWPRGSAVSTVIWKVPIPVLLPPHPRTARIPSR